MSSKERKNITQLFCDWNEAYMPEEMDWGEPVGEEVEPMGNLVEVTFEIDSELKNQVEEIFAEYGLTLEEAIILFFKETVRLQRLPFELDDDLKNEVSIRETK